jgi:hypothetical protein
MSMKVAFNLPKVCTFMSSTNKILKNARETKIHKATEEIRNNAITLGFLASNTLYSSNYGRLDAIHIQCVVITKNTLKTALRKS